VEGWAQTGNGAAGAVETGRWMGGHNWEDWRADGLMRGPLNCGRRMRCGGRTVKNGDDGNVLRLEPALGGENGVGVDVVGTDEVEDADAETGWVAEKSVVAEKEKESPKPTKIHNN
jgi:hypothetical protein